MMALLVYVLLASLGLDPNGCTLPFLLEWAWSKLCWLKNEKDRMCEHCCIVVFSGWVGVFVRVLSMCVCVCVCVCVCMCVHVCPSVLHPSGKTVLDHSQYEVDHSLDPALVSQLFHFSTTFLSLSWFFETLYRASQELLEERGGANTQEGTVWEGSIFMLRTYNHG